MDYLEFIARVTSHIPDKGQVMVRYYGLYANAHRGKVRKTAVSPVTLSEEDRQPPSKGWAAMIRKVYEVDPMICPNCGGTMKRDGLAQPKRRDPAHRRGQRKDRRLLRRLPGRGLTGTQGVIIPHQNVQNLMLRTDVVAAAGRFHIYPIATVDQGIEILTGVPAGAQREDGAFEAGSVNDLVDKEIERLARVAKDAGEEKDAKKD